MKPEILKNLIEYQPGSVISKEILKTASGAVTLFAFDQRQGLSEHTAPYEVLVNIIDGEAEVTISGISHTLSEGHVIIMPANEAHALKANKQFKMLLVMLK
jgi:quercetin dioxygenase-like cupin family protein